VVNHVVFFGNGVSSRTVMQGFKLTGANHFLTKDPPEVEVDASLPRGLFYYADGGAVKIFGASYPTLRDLQIVNNYASPCAGGVSIEQAGQGGGTNQSAVLLENCIFRNNRAQITGAAVDLLPGSSAIISNCLFVGNIANLGINYISENRAAPEFTNSAPLTVFPGSRVTVLNSTFTGNRNGVEVRFRPIQCRLLSNQKIDLLQRPNARTGTKERNSIKSEPLKPWPSVRLAAPFLFDYLMRFTL
jgi:hypothetical protein